MIQYHTARPQGYIPVSTRFNSPSRAAAPRYFSWNYLKTRPMQFYLVLITISFLSFYLNAYDPSPNSRTLATVLQDQPTVYFLPPPLEMQKTLAYCGVVCSGKEWDETKYTGLRSMEQRTDEAFGGRVKWAAAYPEDWPFLIRETDQFALNSIITHRMDIISKRTSVDLASADFLYLSIDTRSVARCFGGCRDQILPDLNRREFQKEVVEWLMETVTAHRGRRNYPSIVISLALIDHDYEFNILSEASQEVIRDDVVVLGIERHPWNTKDSLKYFEQVPYPSVLHSPVYQTFETEVQAKEDLAQWAKSREKTFLLQFAGRAHPVLNNSGKGVFNGFAVRMAMTAQLKASSHPALDLQILEAAGRKADFLAALHVAMSHSTFCLQPPGDSPTRRGMYESVMLGCIPVINRKGTYRTFDTSGLDIEALSVLIDESDILTSQKDIVATLEAIPQKEIEAKRAKMREWANRMIYSLPTTERELRWMGARDWWSDDAFGMILRRLADLRDEGRSKRKMGLAQKEE